MEALTSRRFLTLLIKNRKKPNRYYDHTGGVVTFIFDEFVMVILFITQPTLLYDFARA